MITEINLDQEQDQAVAKKLAQLSRLSRYINDAVDGLVPVLMTMNGSNPITADGKLRKKYAAVTAAIEAVSQGFKGVGEGYGYAWLHIRSYGMAIEFHHPAKSYSVHIGDFNSAGIYTAKKLAVYEPLEMTVEEVTEKRMEMERLEQSMDEIRSRVYLLKQMLAV